VDSFPGREVPKVEREADHLVVALGHQRVRRGLRPKERDPELIDCRFDLVGSTFVLGQVDDQLLDSAEIRFPSLAYTRMHRPSSQQVVTDDMDQAESVVARDHLRPVQPRTVSRAGVHPLLLSKFYLNLVTATGVWRWPES
jgi:hypothetical protein